MGEVIAIDFVNKAKLKPTEVVNLDPDFMEQFRGILVRTGCTEGQIENVMLGIHDYNHYLVLDDHTRCIVDLFLTHARNVI
jgi:hypothetical protein